MNRILKAVLAATATMTFATASLAADPMPRGMFDQNTMLGWQRSAGASAMAYGKIKFHPSKSDAEPARFGVAMTAPYRVNGAGVLLSTQAPRFVDFGFSTKDFQGTWASSLKVGSTQAWSYDPARPAGQQHMNIFESGPSWVVVGLLGAAVIAGTFALTENGT